MATFKKKKSTGSVTYTGPYSWTSNATTCSGGVAMSGAIYTYPSHEEARVTIDINDTDFTFKLLDGTEKKLSAKEYFDFITYNQMTPGDCKDEKEYKEKVMAILI